MVSIACQGSPATHAVGRRSVDGKSGDCSVKSEKRVYALDWEVGAQRQYADSRVSSQIMCKVRRRPLSGDLPKERLVGIGSFDPFRALCSFER